MNRKITALVAAGGFLLLAAALKIGLREEPRQVHPTQQIAAPAPVLDAATKRVDRNAVSGAQERVLEPDLARPPARGFLSVWDGSGTLNPELVRRYGLTSAQAGELNRLRADATKRMQAIDAANARVEVSEDRHVINITVRANPDAARDFSGYLAGELRRILGDRNYSDLAEYYDFTVADEVSHAGLMDKNIEVHKLPPSEKGAEYYIKAERRIKANPPGLPDVHETLTTHAQGSRAKLTEAYGPIVAMLPSDF